VQGKVHGSRFAKLETRAAAASFGLLLAFIIVAVSPLLGSTQSFSVPDDVALRIRFDDTLTSSASQFGDPFSATVVDEGDYRNARVYGHIAQIDMSGKTKGHTSMVLRFDRLVMPDGP
jgi:NAD kinase